MWGWLQSPGVAEDVINAGVCPSVHLSGFADIRLGALMGHAAPSLCLPEYDGQSVTYKGSPASNLCGRISSLFLSLSLTLSAFLFFFFFASMTSFEHCGVLAFQR